MSRKGVNPEQSSPSVPIPTIAYSRAASQLVVQNLKEMKTLDESGNCDGSGGSKSGESYLDFWYSLSGSLGDFRLGNVPGSNISTTMSGKERMDMQIRALQSDSHDGAVPDCEVCGLALVPGTHDTTTKLKSVGKKSRKRGRKKSKSKLIEPQDMDEYEYPPQLSELAATHTKELKNRIHLKCRICGHSYKIPGLPCKGVTTVESASTSTPRPPARDTPSTKKRDAGMPRAIVEGRDFVPLAKPPKKKKKKTNAKGSQLNEFLKTLND